MSIFLLLTLFMIIFFIAFIVDIANESQSKSVTFDYFFILYSFANLFITGFMLILTWTLNKDQDP